MLALAVVIPHPGQVATQIAGGRRQYPGVDLAEGPLVFAAILVFAMELLPGRIGLIGGLFYGLVFGLGGVSAALLGEIADLTSIATVFQICAFLPAIGLLTWFLPDIRS